MTDDVNASYVTIFLGGQRLCANGGGSPAARLLQQRHQYFKLMKILETGRGFHFPNRNSALEKRQLDVTAPSSDLGTESALCDSVPT
ncbi:hypothetical protein JOB18_009128 [Solea senegalensis]|uniref:Uncharacterized protein n=1 Tax=Solea senegalensis TaxID=28829 RepID=A0AAV6RA26_SOLSE|nr:hypothetical protein JOB18_009128 [Solea senegalensis]